MKLVEHPFLSIFLLCVLYVIFQGFIPFFLVGFIYLDFYFYMQFISLALLWFIVVPFGLHLPNGHETYPQYLDSIRLTRIRPATRNLLLGICCAFIVLICTLFGSILTGKYIFDLNQILPPTSFMLIGALTPGIWEEFLFRGAILTILLKKYPVRKAIIYNALMFGIWHGLTIINILWMEMSLLEILGLLIKMFYGLFIGLFLAYLFVKTESLIPGIITHYLIDALVALVIYAPGADVILQVILVYILGFSIIPCILNIFLIKYITKLEL